MVLPQLNLSKAVMLSNSLSLTMIVSFYHLFFRPLKHFIFLLDVLVGFEEIERSVNEGDGPIDDIRVALLNGSLSEQPIVLIITIFVMNNSQNAATPGQLVILTCMVCTVLITVIPHCRRRFYAKEWLVQLQHYSACW